MAGIYRISECKDEYVDHHPYPGQIQRPYLPKIPDNLKVFLYISSRKLSNIFLNLLVLIHFPTKLYKLWL